MDITSEHAAWTREALERLFDLSFLSEHIKAPIVAARYMDGRMLQEAIMEAIKQLNAPAEASPQSLARRIQSVLHLRYVQGLTQSEAAAELNVGLRHLRREQDRAVRAVAMLLFERSAHAPQADSAVAVAADVKLSSEPEARASLDGLLRSSLDVFEPLLRQHHVIVNVMVPPSLPMARANPMVVRQLLISILTWLIQEMPDSTCEVQVSLDDHWLTVNFTGPVAPHVTHGSDVFSRKEELQTIAQLAGMAHAEVTCQATVGANWTVLVRLPASPKKAVLMVDDNMDAIRLAQRYLEQSEEFNLVSLSMPGDALQQAKSLRPICVLLDVMMPDHDGWELLTQLKSDPETSSIPVIVTSILTDHGLARALGASSFLPRPFSALQLVAALRSAIALSAQSQATLSA
jgi:CheY-like chemotaxis protein